MEKIINRFKDENGFIKNFILLYKLIKANDISSEDALEIIEKLYDENKEIKESLKRKYNYDKRIIDSRNSDKEFIDYIPKVEGIIHKKSHKYNEKENIDFYIEYINENLENDNFLDILPKKLDKDSIIIFARILNHYQSIINFNKSLLAVADNKEDIDYLSKELIIPFYIFNKILTYKEQLKNITIEEKEVFKNSIVYFMKDDKPYIYYDIVDSPEVYDSINMLIDSIINGTFKGLCKMTYLPDLLEVRDIRDCARTRVFFTRVKDAYCIVGAMTNKTDCDSHYNLTLQNRLKLYNNNKNNISNNSKDLLKILGGDTNE